MSKTTDVSKMLKDTVAPVCDVDTVDNDVVRNFLHIGNWISFKNIDISGLRIENSVVAVTYRDLPLATKYNKPEETRFSIRLSVADQFPQVKELLGWYRAVTKANDLLGDCKGDNSLTKWSSLKKQIETSPDGVYVFSLEGCFPCAWRLEGINDGKPGFLVMEFSYETCAKSKSSGRSVLSCKTSDKENQAKFICSLQFDSSSVGPAIARSVSDFGSKCGVETIMFGDTRRWMTVKDGEIVHSPIRLELEVEGQKDTMNYIFDLYETQKNDPKASGYEHMSLKWHHWRGGSLLELKLRQVLIRSIEVANVEKGKGAKYIIEIMPRDIRIDTPAFDNKDGWATEYQNFALSLSEKETVFGGIDSETTSMFSDFKSTFLTIKPTFLSNSIACSFSPIESKASENAQIDKLPDSYMTDIVKPGYHSSPRWINMFPVTSAKEWSGGEQRIRVEFYVYASAKTPISMPSSSLSAKLDNLLLFLVYGGDSLLSKDVLHPSIKDGTRLSSTWKEDKLVDAQRHFLEIDTHSGPDLVMTIEAASYAADRFDRAGKPTRFKVQITGVSAGFQRKKNDLN